MTRKYLDVAGVHTCICMHTTSKEPDPCPQGTARPERAYATLTSPYAALHRIHDVFASPALGSLMLQMCAPAYACTFHPGYLVPCPLHLLAKPYPPLGPSQPLFPTIVHFATPPPPLLTLANPHSSHPFAPALPCASLLLMGEDLSN